MLSSKSSKQSHKLQKFAGDVVTTTLFTLAAILPTSLKASAFSFTLNDTGGNAPSISAGGGNLTGIFKAATDWWNLALPSNGSLTIDYKWENLGGYYQQENQKLITLGGVKDRDIQYNEYGVPTKAIISFNNQYQDWFLDPTPYNSEEYQAFQLGASDIDGTTINTKRLAQANSTSSASNKIDLLSVVMHEMGHALGFASGSPGVKQKNLNSSILGIPIQIDANGSHIGEPNNPNNLNDPYIGTLMYWASSNSQRKLPSAADIIVVGETNGGIAQVNTLLFPDVAPNNTFAKYIYALAANKVVSGNNGLFLPEQNVTRGELAKFVVNGFGISPPTSLIIPESGYFSDVPQNYVFSSYLNTLKSMDIISGFPDGTFRPQQNVTRGELAKFIAKAGNYDRNKYGNTQFFPDVDSSNTFYSFINTLKGYGVINGFEDGTFKPNTPVTRGELAKFIVNGFDKAFVNSFTDNRGKTYLYGANQNNAIAASSTQNNWKYFSNVPSGLWYDPLTTYGLQYEALGDSLFTNILNFPTGIAADNQFTVSVGNNILGNFSPGQSVDFTSLLGSGVSQFTVTIASLLQNTTDIPFQLAFNNDRGSFRMQEFTKEESDKNPDAPPESVPEPSSILGSLLGLGFLVNHGRKKQKATVNSR